MRRLSLVGWVRDKGTPPSVPDPFRSAMLREKSEWVINETNMVKVVQRMRNNGGGRLKRNAKPDRSKEVHRGNLLRMSLNKPGVNRANKSAKVKLAKTKIKISNSVLLS